MSYNSHDAFRNRDFVQGEVVDVSENQAYVDIGAHMDAVISKEHFSVEPVQDLRKVLKPRDEIEAQIIVLNDEVIRLSRLHLEKNEKWDEFVNNHQIDEVAEFIFTDYNKGGLISKGAYEVFMPNSQIDVKKVDDLDAYLNIPLQAIVTEIDQRRRTVKVSRRTLLEAETIAAQKSELEEVNVGDIIEMPVSKIIAGKGLNLTYKHLHVFMPISELDHLRIRNIEEIAKVGDVLSVEIIEVDKEKRQLLVSRKRTLKTPWDLAKEVVTAGAVLKGTVVHFINDIGVLVELSRGVAGFLHQNDLSYDTTKKLKDVLKLKDVVEVKVIDVKDNEQKIQLSMKALENDPWQVVIDTMRVGDIVKGHVTNLQPRFAKVEVSPLVFAKLNLNEATTRENVTMRDVLAIDQEVEAMITALDTDKRIMELSIVQVEKENERKIFEEYLASNPEG